MARRDDDEKVVFVSAERRKAQSGAHYIWSKTFDMEEIAKELGTKYVTVTIIKPKNARGSDKVDPDDVRTIIFKPSEKKYLPGSRSGGGEGRSSGGGEGRGSRRSDDDFID
jgi:hypothetical protein